MAQGIYTIRTAVVFLGRPIKVTAVCSVEIVADKSTQGWSYIPQEAEIFFGESMGQTYEWPQLAPEVQAAICEELDTLALSSFGVDLDDLRDDVEDQRLPALPGAYTPIGTWARV